MPRPGARPSRGRPSSRRSRDDRRRDAPRRDADRRAPSSEASMYAEISSALCRGLSATILPSPRKITRSAWLAAIGSWVTIAIDWPWSRLAAASSPSTSRPLRESRLPVGSSANTRSGAVASARAIATRCCWPPRQLVRAVPQPVGPSPSVSTRPSMRARSSARRATAVEVEREQDVAERVEGRHEVERLEDEAHAPAAQDRELEVGEAGDVGVADPGAAGGRGIQSRHDVHERRLARSGRPHDRGELAATDADAHAVEGAHGAPPGAVGLGELLHPGGEAQVCRCEVHASTLRTSRAGARRPQEASAYIARMILFPRPACAGLSSRQARGGPGWGGSSMPATPLPPAATFPRRRRPATRAG